MSVWGFFFVFVKKKNKNIFATQLPIYLQLIGLLAECELVTQEQQGREYYYRLEIDKMKEIDQWLEQFKTI